MSSLLTPIAAQQVTADRIREAGGCAHGPRGGALAPRRLPRRADRPALRAGAAPRLTVSRR